MCLPSQQSLFLTPLKEYDMLIKLRTKANPRGSHGVAYTHTEVQPVSKFRNSPVSGAPVLADFDPVRRFVHELKGTYGELALFLFDELGGEVIAVVWKPAAFLPSRFKVSSASSTIPLTSDFSAEVFSALDTLAQGGAAAAGNKKPKKSAGERGEALLVLPNIAQVVANIRHLGKDLVKDIVLQ